ncbi:hypothetical protein BLNAU_21364 [Blattamonas nauphoetae]|uniref:Uncharacterized protein n=1 Tax=Blattamonas nauphoetae TaxID=2049346 RepID=A0ABQ9WWL9_9EUKA|nr:hypothetical protein BLNAU_21364 [Blattamonas nauphoetae]
MSTIPSNTTAKTFQPTKATQPPPPSSETKFVSSIKKFVPLKRQTAPVPTDTPKDAIFLIKPDAKEFKPKPRPSVPSGPIPTLSAADSTTIKPFVPKSKPIPPPEPTPEFPSTVPTPNAIFAPPAATQYRIAPQNPPLFSSPTLVTPNQHDDIDPKTILVEKAKVFVPSAPKNPSSGTPGVTLKKPKALQATDELNTSFIQDIPSVSGVSLDPHQTVYKPSHNDQEDARRAFKKKRANPNYLNAARSLLNKITISNFQDVIDELFGVLVSREVLSHVIDIVYEKAIHEAQFPCSMSNTEY